MGVLTITLRGRKIKLTKAMHAKLEYGLKFPAMWHNIGLDPVSKETVARLLAEDLIEVRDYSNQWRLKQ